MELFIRFTSSPEMTAHATSLFQHATGSATNLVQSSAFAQMMQGMMKNYSEFVMELNQSSMALMNLGQAAMVLQVQEDSDRVIDVTDMCVRRSRQAA